MIDYGKELILDLHNCNVDQFTRKHIKKYFIKLCNLINMEREDLHFWDYAGQKKEYKKAPDHLKGTSAIQFISTSNITIHTLDKLQKVFVNIFSCKDFDENDVSQFTQTWFNGIIINKQIIRRL